MTHCGRNRAVRSQKLPIHRSIGRQAGESRAARSRKLQSCPLYLCASAGRTCCMLVWLPVRSSRILPARCFGFGSPSMLCHDEAKHPARPSTACATTAGAATHGERLPAREVNQLEPKYGIDVKRFLSLNPTHSMSLDVRVGCTRSCRHA